VSSAVRCPLSTGILILDGTRCTFIYSLQDTLGHTSLDMVRTYLRIAQADRKAAHRRASPVENWRL